MAATEAEFAHKAFGDIDRMLTASLAAFTRMRRATETPFNLIIEARQ